MKKFSFYKISGIAFVFIIFLFFFLSIILPSKKFSPEENRVLEQAPKFSLSTYFEGRFEKKSDNFFNDQLPFRNQLIRLKTSWDMTLGEVESNRVYIGDGNYLIEDISLPSKEMKKAQLEGLQAFRNKYPTLPAYFLLAPTSGNILKDNLPLGVKLKDQNTYMDTFFKNIKEMGITPIDVRKDFLKSKNKTQIYYRTDHHWTTKGAYLAFLKASKSMNLNKSTEYEALPLRGDFRGTLASKSGLTNGKNDEIEVFLPKNPDSFLNSLIYFSDTKEKTTNFYQMDNLHKKDAYTIFGGWNHPYYTISTPTKSPEKLLLIKDSYANCFIPFLTQSFREIVVVDPRYFFGNIDDIIKSEGITQVMFLYNANTFSQDEALGMMFSQ